jgi:hypothetical protein
VLRTLGTWLAYGLLLLVATAGGAVVVEGGYRLYLGRALTVATDADAPPAAETAFTFYSRPEPWRFARNGGFEYNEGRWLNGIIEKGEFKVCGFFGEGNRYGGFGKLEQDWDGAELRVLLLGSSYTLSTDVGEQLRQGLESALRRRVALLNLSRDATGILTMFDIAAEKIEELRPDLVLFTFNTSAFGYGRHWREVRPVSDDAGALVLLKDPEPLAPRTRSLPQPAIVSALASPQWCEEMTRAREVGDTARLRDDATVRALIDAYEVYRSSLARPPVVIDFLRTDVSFAWNTLVYQQPFHGMTLREEVAIFTPLEILDYAQDETFMAALERVKASDVPFTLLLIPALPEMEDGADYAFGRFGVREDVERALSASLESLTGQAVDHLWKRYTAAEQREPRALVLGEKDWHPNAAGGQALANALKQVVLEHLPPARVGVGGN